MRDGVVRRLDFHGIGDGRDTAWVISTAEYDEGNPEKYINTQLMVLTRDTGDWRIRTISWSSNQP